MKIIREARVKKVKIGTICRESNGWQTFYERHQAKGTIHVFNYERDKPYFFQCVETGTVYHVDWLEFISQTLFDFE